MPYLQPIFLGCQNFGWIGHLVFLVSIWSRFFKNLCDSILYVKFLEAEQIFFIKIDSKFMSITPIKQTILIHNFNLNKKNIDQIQEI